MPVPSETPHPIEHAASRAHMRPNHPYAATTSHTISFVSLTVMPVAGSTPASEASSLASRGKTCAVSVSGLTRVSNSVYSSCDGRDANDRHERHGR